MALVKVSDYLLGRVADEGVRHVFFLPGGGAMHLNASLGKEKRLSYVSNLHEQASAIAAEAYARVTNDIGVALLTTGPGGLNAVTGVAAAYLDSTPCLFISGQVKRADDKTGTGLRQLGVQEVDIISVVQSITKYAVRVNDPESIRFHFEKALHLARTGRRGPVWLDVPLDVQGARVETDKLAGFTPEPEVAPPGLAEGVSKLFGLLAEAKRPVLVAGNGIRLAGAQQAFVAFAERLGVPVLTTWLGLDLMADDHPLMVGRPGSVAPRGANFAIQNSDLMISIGSRLDMAMTGYAHDRLARGAKKVLVDIDEAEIRKMRTRIDLPIVADAGQFLAAARKAAEGMPEGPWADWRARCAEWKRKYPVVTPEFKALDRYVSTYVFSDVLSDLLPEGETLVTGSSGAAIEIFLLAYRVKAGQRVFHNRGLGSMGFGLPAAIGACFANGRKRTVCVEGDGSLQLNIQELQTVVEHKLPIKLLIMNNGGYASIRTSQQRHFGLLVGADASSGLSLPDTLKIAQAYGIPATRIEDQRDLAGRLRDVLAADGPAICELMMPPEEPRQPSLVSVQRPDGSMYSPPLEDLWPLLDREELRANMLVDLVER